MTKKGSKEVIRINLIRENRYVGGDMLDIDIFTVKKTGKTRKSKAKPTSEVQERLNRKSSEKKLRRTIHLKFRAGRDWELHLTFSSEFLPKSDDDHKREIQNFMRRVKRLYKKHGEEKTLKYIIVLGGRDGMSRRHAHITITGTDKFGRSDLEALWKLGTANADRLQDRDDRMFSPLSHYVGGTKQFIRSDDVRGKKSWWGSRNLEKPKADQRTGHLSQRAVRELIFTDELDCEAVEKIYPGYRVVEYEVTEPDIFGQIYINVLMKRRRNDRR